MSGSEFKTILKLFGFYYLKFFLGVAVLFIFNALLFHFVLGIKLQPLTTYIQLMFSLPLLITIMALGFAAWEGKLKDKINDR